jgi:NAD(P)-dependent dehydrogenase (short-subunit alcohol dehydrogenase family)
MGRVSAIKLAELGAQVLIVGHNETRGRVTAEEIRASGGAAEFLRADIANAEEVSSLAEQVIARDCSIDVLINSAGGLVPSAARTQEGIDRGLAQNFLGAFLLTRQLEDRLLASAPARVINVGSAAHRLVKSVDLDAYMHPVATPSPKGRYQMRSYQTAKLAVTAWTFALARRWRGKGVTANVLDPGIVKGQSGSEQYEGPALLDLLMSQVIPFFVAKSFDRGSEQYVRLAADPELANVTGMYFVSGKEKDDGGSILARDQSVQGEIEEAANRWAAPFL